MVVQIFTTRCNLLQMLVSMEFEEPELELTVRSRRARL